MNKKWCIDTEIIRHTQQPNEMSGVISQSIVLAVAYAFPNVETAADVVCGLKEGVFYGRYGNPTTETLEEKIAAFEGGEACIGLNSGMSAISSALFTFLQHGDHVIVTKDIYGGAYSFITFLSERFGISFDFVDCTDTNEIKNAIKENTKAIYIETPSNPCLTILDIEKISEISKENAIPLIVDNTFMSPYLQQPLKLGADIVVHSATKYINGHGDVLAGFVVGKKEHIDFIRKKIAGDLGQNLNAWESYLILRGLKTLAIRIQKHCTNAQMVAEYLEKNPMIEKVYYPGLPSHPHHELAVKQMKGMGGIVAFEVKGGVEFAKRFINHLKLAIISFSLGDPETLVQHPASMTHFSIPEKERLRFGVTDGMVRLSVGLEDPNDIIADLDQALVKVPVHRSLSK